MSASPASDPRWIGAVAGLGPAVLILGYYVITGGPIQTGLITIVVAAIAAGWFIGPRVRGTLRSDLPALLGYVLAGYLVHSVINLVASIWVRLAGIADLDAPSLTNVIGVQLIVTLVYAPVWVVFLSPVALAWVLIVRVLSDRSRVRHLR
jgi:hypothetical protein